MHTLKFTSSLILPLLAIHALIYSATSIIQTFDYPDYLETIKYITTHVQKAWPVVYCGHDHRLGDELRTLQTCLGQNWLSCTRLLF